MEELYIVGGWFRGRTVIANLPEKMRILYISHAKFKEAHVDYETIPRSAKLIAVTRMEKKMKVRIHPIGQTTRDVPVTGSRTAAERYLAGLGKAYVLA